MRKVDTVDRILVDVVKPSRDPRRFPNAPVPITVVVVGRCCGFDDRALVPRYPANIEIFASMDNDMIGWEMLGPCSTARLPARSVFSAILSDTRTAPTYSVRL